MRIDEWVLPPPDPTINISSSAPFHTAPVIPLSPPPLPCPPPLYPEGGRQQAAVRHLGEHRQRGQQVRTVQYIIHYPFLAALSSSRSLVVGWSVGRSVLDPCDKSSDSSDSDEKEK